MKNFLKEEERENLKIRHRKERDRRVADRIKAILLSNKGWTYCQIAEALLLDEATISTHIQDFLDKQKLKPENGGSQSKLNDEQTQELINFLEIHTFIKVVEICAYVEKKYGLIYSKQGMIGWLHNHSFSFKKPKTVPRKIDSIKQQEFISYYEDLCKRASDNNDPILFMDSVHPTMATKITYRWIRTGTDKMIATTASRTRLNITGALELKTMKLVHNNYETINGDSVIELFQKLEKEYPTATIINVIADQSGYHCCKKVEAWMQKSKIKLNFLPAYSPNLNPIERLWKVVNEYVRNNKYFNSAREFKAEIFKFFQETWDLISQQMKTRINDNFQVIKFSSSA
jgi:transposase